MNIKIFSNFERVYVYSVYTLNTYVFAELADYFFFCNAFTGYYYCFNSSFIQLANDSDTQISIFNILLYYVQCPSFPIVFPGRVRIDTTFI